MALGTLKDKVIGVIYTAAAVVGIQGLLCLGGKCSAAAASPPGGRVWGKYGGYHY